MRGRYPNVKRTTVGNVKFASQGEGRRYSQLLLMQRAEVISELKLQVRFPITIGGVDVIYDSGRQMSYVADFTYVEEGKVVIEDFKGHQTQVFKMKRALMKAMGHTIRLT